MAKKKRGAKRKPSATRAQGATTRARPQRARRKDARPSELIEAGLAEFALHGFAGTRLEDVARRAGVVKGTIYRYFADKEALFEAAVRSRVPAYLDQLGPVIDAHTGTTRELLTGVLARIYTEMIDSEIRVLVRIILSEGERFPELAELYFGATIARGRPLLEKIVARGVARGEIRADHASLVHLMIVAPAIMASLWKMNFDRFEPLSIEAFMEAHLEVLTRGLLVPGENASG